MTQTNPANKRNPDWLISFLTLALLISVIFNTFLLIKSPPGNDPATDCSNLPQLKNGARRTVTKVIDGDTVIIEGGSSVRLLGLDADERGGLCYQPAKDKLKELVEKKEIRLTTDQDNHDQWCRYLRHAFLEKENIGVKLIRLGLATARLPANTTKFRQQYQSAESEAKEESRGCEWSDDRTITPSPITNTPAPTPATTSFQKLTPENTGLEIVPACQANKLLGKTVIVEGRIVDSHFSSSETVFLNFGSPYPQQCFTAVIFSSALNKFPRHPQKYYAGQFVRVKGLVKLYQGQPEIILENIEQIEVAP